MSRLLRTLTNLHVALAKPMSRSSVVALCRLVEILQGVRSMYHRHSVTISRSVVHVSQHLLYQALTTVSAAKVNTVSISILASFNSQNYEANMKQ